MADFRINVIVDPSGARRGTDQVERGLNRTGNAADKLRRRLAQAFTIAGIGFAVRSLIRMADTLTNLNNRLRLVTTSEQNLVAVNRELFNIANRTRSSFEATTELFARVAVSSKELGVSQQQLLQFTESLNQAITLSGATAIEAQAGLIQLSQGLASGALRGDELRSVLEQLPAVADVIAKSLGVTRGALREMGKEGQITANVVIEAFAKAREELAEKFASTIPTVGQSLTVLRNNFLQLLGEFNEAFGVTEELAKVILLLANNIEALIPVVAGLATVIGVALAAKAIPALITGIGALWAIITAHPIGLLLTILAGLIVALIDAAGRMDKLGESFGATGRAVSAFGQLVWDAIQVALDALGDLLQGIQRLFPVFGLIEIKWTGVGNAFLAVIEQMVNAIDFLRAVFISAYSGIIEAWNGLPDAFERIALKALNGAIELVEDGVNVIKDLIESIPFVTEEPNISFGRLTSLSEGASPAGAAAAAAGRDQGDNLPSFEDERGVLNRRFDELREPSGAASPAGGARAAAELQGYTQATNQATAASKGLNEEFAKILQNLDQEAQLLMLSRPEREIQAELFRIEKTLKRELTEQEHALVEAKLRANQELAVERQLLDEINGPLENYKTQLSALERLLAKGAITTEQFNKKQMELKSAVSDSSSFIESAFEKAFSSAADALAEFVRTGQFDFKKFVNNLLADITRLAANQLFKQLLSGGLFGGGGGGGGGLFGGGGGGGGGGGILGGLFGGGGGGGLFGFANGGAFEVAGRGGVDRNLLSVNGAPVARVSRGEKVSVSREDEDSGGSGRPVQVVMNIQTTDADSFQRSQDQILQRTQFALDRARRRNA